MLKEDTNSVVTQPPPPAAAVAAATATASVVVEEIDSAAAAAAATDVIDATATATEGGTPTAKTAATTATVVVVSAAVVNDFLHSLPPMDRTELKMMVNSLYQLPILIQENKGEEMSTIAVGSIHDLKQNNDTAATTTTSGEQDIVPHETLVSTSTDQWTELVIEPFWKEYDILTCCISNPMLHDKTATTGTPSWVYVEEMQHFQNQIRDYQTSHYAKKDGVMASFSAVEEQVQVSSSDTITADDAPMVDNSVPTEPTLSSLTCIVLHTYVEHLDSANCSAGSWKGYWRIQMMNEVEATLTGYIQLHTHYAEIGNSIQTKAKRNFNTTTISTKEEVVNSLVAKLEKSTLSYAEKLVTKIVQQIVSNEEQYYSSLDHCFNHDMEDTVRKLRRILPITKTRFKWDSSAQRNVQLLNARNNKK
jgi:F-actin capping protein alpha subunit